jgi:hypothetical protein
MIWNPLNYLPAALKSSRKRHDFPVSEVYHDDRFFIL